MIVAIMQPAYLPWLGFFDRLDACDLCILLDHVAMDRSSKTKFANRNKIRTPQGWSWLTIPLDLHGSPPLNAIPLAQENTWQKKHLASINHAYSRTPWYPKYRDFFVEYYSRSKRWLHEATNESFDYIAQSLDIKTPVILSSQLDVKGSKSELIFNLCLEVKAKTYISGPFGRSYLDSTSFENQGIQLLFHDYKHPTYKQAFNGFEMFMSSIDLLFNHGPKSKEIIISGRCLKPGTHNQAEETDL